MAGLTGHGWSTPENWAMVRGPALVSQWDQILGHQRDGTPWLVPGLSILYYAGDGRFCYSHDMLNMTHVGETLKAMEWRPPGGLQHAAAPAEPRRLAARGVGAPRSEPGTSHDGVIRATSAHLSKQRHFVHGTRHSTRNLVTRAPGSL